MHSLRRAAHCLIRRHVSHLRPETLLAAATQNIQPFHAIFRTLASNPLEDSGAVSPAIYMTSTFARNAQGDYHSEGEHVYGRLSNPNRARLEAVLAQLDGAEEAMVFSSGMQATHAVLQCCLKPGDRVLISDDLYFGVKSLLDEVFSLWNVTYTSVDQTDTALVQAMLSDGYQMLWLESPSNPLLKIPDIEALTTTARAHNVVSVVDSTWAPPLISQPLALGADVVVHSTTKFIAGHSDVTGGSVALAASFLHREHLRTIQTIGGGVPSPFDCWLTARGLRTLSVRLERQTQNADVIARYLEQHPKVERVYYPGLASHPQHMLARKQMTSFGSMLSFGVVGGEKEAWRLKQHLQLIVRATSLGATETLIEHRRSVETHPVSPPNLLRLSVGLEHVDDLLEDLDQALVHV